MLNPRSFLEDTIRCGMVDFWSHGMPWHLVAPAIDTDFNYDVSHRAKADWAARTGHDWDNTKDPMVKTLKCPACHMLLQLPWTTCGTEQNPSGQDPDSGLTGQGYGDGDLKIVCTTCSVVIDSKLLAVAQFIRDAQSLVVNDVPMPGTVLGPVSGRPDALFRTDTTPEPRLFPNRLVERKLMSHLVELIRPGVSPTPTMDTVRELVEKAISNGDHVRILNEQIKVGKYATRLTLESRVCLRKMMGRYWENASPFALDLSGAVMRQGVFTAKMVQIDWLHSPACRETMQRLIIKFDRFLALMRAHPTKTCVPTLDVDLAWHTSQLTPSAYYALTTEATQKFINHDDKMDEGKLSDAFEWTTQAYQERYGEVYSECTCWYCEAVRAAGTSSVSRLLGASSQDKIAQGFHESGRASLCPPDRSAHVSAHNAVRQLQPRGAPFTRQEKLLYHRRERQQRQLELNYQKACRRAQRKGRKLPPRDEYYDHWGYQYYMYSPFMYPMYFSPGIYPGCDPGYSNAAGGAWANCAAGSCGNGVSAGSCGGPGGCGGVGSGGCAAGGVGGSCGGGGGGGGGGGCGGGGGGCGGGGGGGGGGCGGGGC